MRFWLFLALLLAPSILSAQSVDILYQGSSYVPPFYRGAALWPEEGVINLAAIPQGLGNPASLNYKWIQNGTVLGSLSGTGKNKLSIKDTVFSKPQNIAVEIVSAQDDVLAKSVIVIRPAKTELLVYEKHPLYGFLFHREASGTYPLVEEEVSFSAFPLFFSVLNPEVPNLTYSWRSGSGVDSNVSSVIYRSPEGTKGSARVTVKASNTDTFKQVFEKSFLVQFDYEE